MKFDELDRSLRIYETAHDHCVLPGIYMVARIDGRNFTRLTKEILDYQTPYDERFRDLMILTVKHLMSCGFKVIYGYTESDEISLLFDPNISTFGRKLRKYHSVLAAEASACFSMAAQTHATFDARISQIPDSQRVVDYFRWRNEDAHRNALNSWCYWTLRKEGDSPRQATAALEKKTVAQKNELLFQRGINFNELPLWQRRGVGLYWQDVEKLGWNPKSQQETRTQRQEITVDMTLPMKDDYSQFVRQFVFPPN